MGTLKLHCNLIVICNHKYLWKFPSTWLTSRKRRQTIPQKSNYHLVVCSMCTLRFVVIALFRNISRFFRLLVTAVSSETSWWSILLKWNYVFTMIISRAIFGANEKKYKYIKVIKRYIGGTYNPQTCDSTWLAKSRSLREAEEKEKNLNMDPKVVIIWH